MHSLKHLGLPQIRPCSFVNVSTPGGANALEGPNPGQSIGGVVVAQRGPAFVLHLSLHMLEVDPLEALSLAMLDKKYEEEKRLEGGETHPGGFCLSRF